MHSHTQFMQWITMVVEVSSKHMACHTYTVHTRYTYTCTRTCPQIYGSKESKANIQYKQTHTRTHTLYYTVYTTVHKMIASLLNRKLIICSSSLFGAVSNFVCFVVQCSYCSIFMLIRKMWLCFPALLCFISFSLKIFSFVFSAIVPFCCSFFHRCASSLLSYCFAYTIFSVYAPLAWWAYSHHILLHQWIQKNIKWIAIQMFSHTISTTTDTAAAVAVAAKNEISAFFGQRAPKTYWESNIITAVYCET